MAWHTMVLSEPHPTKAGFISRYFAVVDVAMSGMNWIWRQVDHAVNYVDNSSAPLTTESDALNDALNKLNGDNWE